MNTKELIAHLCQQKSLAQSVASQHQAGWVMSCKHFERLAEDAQCVHTGLISTTPNGYAVMGLPVYFGDVDAPRVVLGVIE